MPVMIGSSARDNIWQPTPALKECVTTGLSRKELEKAGVTIRPAITKIMKRGENQAKRISDSSR